MDNMCNLLNIYFLTGASLFQVHAYSTDLGRNALMRQPLLQVDQAIAAIKARSIGFITSPDRHWPRI